MFIDPQLELLALLFQMLEPKLVLLARERSNPRCGGGSCGESAVPIRSMLDPLDLMCRWLLMDPKNLEESRMLGDVDIPGTSPFGNTWSSVVPGMIGFTVVGSPNIMLSL
ncbi:hypothetical protein OGAPHI_001217 [Ogataea philodendri]|uniref:Uncharacterized protein n=1 Tax=Ogataea philodendri TaxID=1378263 RepID=A0A9P8PF45_9ASCO|nr:uncharacterized protein OGAPHI_001217 [Ogataea philodendri]KAH3670702.1 hypothetical protein OGAPHI_001217 [Ogataea philodendri]